VRSVVGWVLTLLGFGVVACAIPLALNNNDAAYAIFISGGIVGVAGAFCLGLDPRLAGHGLSAPPPPIQEVQSLDAALRHQRRTLAIITAFTLSILVITLLVASGVKPGVIILTVIGFMIVAEGLVTIMCFNAFRRRRQSGRPLTTVDRVLFVPTGPMGLLVVGFMSIPPVLEGVIEQGRPLWILLFPPLMFVAALGFVLKRRDI
jgi:hypothetical protein